MDAADAPGTSVEKARAERAAGRVDFERVVGRTGRSTSEESVNAQTHRCKVESHRLFMTPSCVTHRQRSRHAGRAEPRLRPRDSTYPPLLFVAFGPRLCYDVSIAEVENALVGLERPRPLELLVRLVTRVRGHGRQLGDGRLERGRCDWR
jgi:hypothetical protein